MSTPLRVLIVEDSEADMILIVHELRRHGYDLTFERVETAEAMKAALDTQQWDVILSDYSMPSFNAPAALKLAQDKGIDIPFIIVSGTVGEDAAVAAMKAGAHDFFAKDKLARVVPAIERELREADDRRKRRWAEEELSLAEQRFAKAFQTVPMGLVITALDGTFIDVNDYFLLLSEYSRNEVIGQTSFEIGLWVDPEDTIRVVQALREGRTVRDWELRFRTKSGILRDVLCSLATIDLSGQVCILAMFHDITERKRAEQALRQSEERFSKIFRASPLAITISTLQDGRFLDVNESFSRITSYSRDEAIGRTSHELNLLMPGDRETAVNELGEAGKIHNLEGQFRTKGGEIRDVLVSIELIELEGEWRILGMSNDVTELKRIERELLEAERLRVEIAKERELIQLKERFISVVSHEFRTPLSVIMSSADLVQSYYDRMPRERQLEHIHEVLSQAEFMVGLLDDVLTVNKARAGRLEFNPAPLDLMAFCQATLERIQALDKGKHNFVFTHKGDLSNIVLDAKLLQHILVNLLSNAVKYSPDGGDVRLEVSRQGDEAILYVSDQGIGIPLEAQARLFEPFHRAENVGNISGTGLGLAIVKESVDLHGGTIICESIIRVGTTFTVRMPC